MRYMYARPAVRPGDAPATTDVEPPAEPDRRPAKQELRLTIGAYLIAIVTVLMALLFYWFA